VKRPNLLLKLAALSTSIILVAAFVSYRAGAFDRFFKSNAAPVDPGTAPDGFNTMIYSSKSAEIIPPPAGQATDSAPPAVFMGGSKYAPIVPTPPPGSATNPPTQSPEVFMGSSKSLILTDPKAKAKQGTQAPNPAPPDKPKN